MEAQALAALLTRQRQLVEMLTAEKNSLLSAPPPIRKSVRAYIPWLEQELLHTDTNLINAIRQCQVWRGPRLALAAAGESPRIGHADEETDRGADRLHAQAPGHSQRVAQTSDSRRHMKAQYA